MLWRRQWHPTPVLLPGNSHGRRSLVGCSCSESDTTEPLHFHFSLSCIGEGNGNPLCSCLENPRDRGAWWAAVCGVTQSRTRLSDYHFHFLSTSWHVLEFGFKAKPLTMVSWKSTHMGQSQYIVTVGENAQKPNLGCTITEVLCKHYSNILKPFISSATLL